MKPSADGLIDADVIDDYVEEQAHLAGRGAPTKSKTDVEKAVRLQLTSKAGRVLRSRGQGAGATGRVYVPSD